MCRIAAADGITHMVATPHANDRYPYDRSFLTTVLDHLRDLVGDSIQLTLGCDFHLSYENLQSALDRPHNYTIGATSYLLVELSNYSVPMQMSDCFIKLGDRDLTPILTHPERNPILQQTPQRILDWVEQGCLVQVTASALTGAWGERTQGVARWLLERGAVHVLASDAHDIKRRAPILSPGRAAAAEIATPEVAKALVEDNPAAIVAGQPLPYLPNLKV